MIVKATLKERNEEVEKDFIKFEEKMRKKHPKLKIEIINNYRISY